MKTFILVLFVGHISSQDFNPCLTNEGNLEVVEAFSLYNRMYIVTPNELIRGDIQWTPDSGEFRLQNTKKMATSALIESTKLTFAVNYGSEGKRVVYVLGPKANEIEPLKGRRREYDKGTGEAVGQGEDCALNTYTYKPVEDQMNLQSLFSKLPNENIGQSLRAAANFPLDGSPNLPPRIFVYYVETPDQTAQSVDYKSLRFLFRADNVTYDGDKKLLVWQVEDVVQCGKLNNIVNASLPIDDYKDNKFHLMEISGSIYRITQIDVNQLNNPVNVGRNFVGSIFGCKQTSTLPPDESSGGKTNGGSWFWIIILILLVMVVSIAAVGYFLVKQNQNSKEDKNAQMAAQPRNLNGNSAPLAPNSSKTADIETGQQSATLPPQQPPQAPVNESGGQPSSGSA